jgi:hypothetical protein
MERREFFLEKVTEDNVSMLSIIIKQIRRFLDNHGRQSMYHERGKGPWLL